MQISSELLDSAADAVRAFHGADIGGLSHGRLLEAHDAAARARRAADVLLAALAAEVAQRSAAGGLARAEGFSSPQRLVASLTGGSLAEAHRLVDAGTLLLEQTPPPDAVVESAPDAVADEPARELLPGDPVPGDATAQALRTGDIGVEAAALLRATITRVQAAVDAGLADPDAALVVERRLLGCARTLSLGQLRRACVRAEANASPAAWEQRERRQHQARCVSVGSDSDGMVVITARLDPPSAAPVIAWLDAQVRDAFQRRRDHDTLDERTAGQIRADVLVALARHGLTCDTPTTGVATTVVVRMSLEQLRDANNTKSGIADCDTLTTPITAAAARLMAADAEAVPLVLGGVSEVLDIGRARRLFTRAQRLALVERDGGCAWCHAPPSYCDAHHIRWWTKDTGPTDLSNGVLLCVSCHHRLHDTGWDVQVKDGQVYFIPPITVDPTQTPRLGGRARLEPSAA
nr:MAG: HNH endonuclease [Mycolicibacterium hassiacum]